MKGKRHGRHKHTHTHKERAYSETVTFLFFFSSSNFSACNIEDGSDVCWGRKGGGRHKNTTRGDGEGAGNRILVKCRQCNVDLQSLESSRAIYMATQNKKDSGRDYKIRPQRGPHGLEAA